jgi:Zn-dependent protease/predicted transcriptional regulator
MFNMRFSWKIFSWLGIPVFVHWTFGLVLLLFLGWEGWNNGLVWHDIALQLTVLIALFTCVLLHEYGHVLTARHYGFGTRDIILTPIGGIARLEGMPEKPIQELIVAIGGPLVNVLIALLIYLSCKFFFFSEEAYWWAFESVVLEFSQKVIPFARDFSPVTTVEMSPEVSNIDLVLSDWLLLLPILFVMNIVMVVFNMIPAFPMDGGRIFRALLAMPFGRLRATQVAAWLGQFMAVLFVIQGIRTNSFGLTFIGVFVFANARRENAMVQLDHRLSKGRIDDILRTQYHVLNTSDWLQSAADLHRTTGVVNFLVQNMEGRLVGYLDGNDWQNTLKKRQMSASVQDIYREDLIAVRRNDSLHQVYYFLYERRKPILVVIDHADNVLGIIERKDLDKFLN